jgi:hypothetical protein
LEFTGDGDAFECVGLPRAAELRGDVKWGVADNIFDVGVEKRMY